MKKRRNKPPILPAAGIKQLSDADRALFLQAIDNIVPAPTTHAITNTPHIVTKPNLLDFTIHQTSVAIYGSACGVSFAMLQQLRAGKITWHHELDLHGYTQQSAHPLLYQFITAAYAQQNRCVLVITGRGRGSHGGVAVLRDVLPQWLSREPIGPYVLAFCNAKPTDGGLGAFYVLLRRC